MEAGFIKFDPASEFEIIDTLDFEEEVARPESMRFFTLDEQLTDYFDKVLPKKAKITKFEYAKISGEVDRLRDIYRDIITVTDTDYIVDLSRKEVHVPWVKPIYSDFSLNSYSYAESWIPLYNPPLRSTANYYSRMLAALPKPYKTTGEGVPLTLSETVVNEDGLNAVNALGIYQRTKGVIHEDGTFTVVKIPVANTADDIKTRGFFIEARPDEIPQPFPDHPFLASNGSSKLLTEEPLIRVFPTIEAILNHGVPVTEDPYIEGRKYLKIYDVKMNQIPWNLWKERFPPAPTISETPTIQSVKFDFGKDESGPSKKLQDIYQIKWTDGLEPRYWLSLQEDGGSLVAKMLLSNSSKSGLLPPALSNEKPQIQLTLSTAEECLITGTFDEFLNSGVYRSPSWEDVSKAIDKHKPLPSGYCIPTTVIIQERQDALVSGKKAWTETTDVDILKEHQELLKDYQTKENKPKIPKYEKFAIQPQSDIRRMILAVMKDETRFPIDKADAIEKLLRGKDFKDGLYLDSESFLICGHTLAIMKGLLEDDEKQFFETWTTVEEGYRTCTFCSERVSSNVFVTQDDFDEDGNPIISSDVLNTGPSFHGDSHIVSFASSLTQLKDVFNLDNAGESILYLLLSLFQVLPAESQLLPVLQNVKDASAVLRKNSKINKETMERTEGLLGIAAMVVLLQTHNPFLIPRRSFGSKILKLTGFPRDTDDDKDSPVLDIIISVLKTTFSETPGTFKGSVKSLLRKVISKPKEIRKESLPFIKQAYKKFQIQFSTSKDRYVTPIETQQIGQISLPLLLMPKTEYTPDERMGNEEKMGKCNIDIPKTYLAGKLPPNVVQESITLFPTKPSSQALYIQPKPEKFRAVKVTDAETREMVKLGFPKKTKLDKIENFMKSETDGTAFLALLNRILDILTIQKYPFKKLEYYRERALDSNRDATRGLIFKLLHEISKDENSVAFLQKLSIASQRDLTISMILITKEQATQQESELRTREREVFKQRMRSLDDTQREVTKMMLDIGIAPYIITNEDREIFKREYNISDPEEEYSRVTAEEDADRPEEGYNANRDSEEGEAIIVDGREIETDYGDYGDRRERPYDGGDYNTVGFNEDEGMGV